MNVAPTALAQLEEGKLAFLEVKETAPPPGKAARFSTNPILLEEGFKAAENSITEFVTRLECRLAILKHKPGCCESISEEVSFIFQKILMRECGRPETAFIRTMLGNLFAPNSIKELVRGIVRSINRGAPKKENEARKILGETEYFLHWYLRRKKILQRMTEKAKSDIKKGVEGLYQLESCVLNDWNSHQALEVRAAVFLLPHEKRRLWFKVFIKQSGSPVATAEGWHSWQDRTECPSHDQAGPAAAILPLTPVPVPVFLDNIKVHIPLSALQLAAGDQNIELHAGVYDQGGRQLFGEGLDVELQLSSSRLSQTNGCRIPSPQSLLLWQFNPCDGVEISSMQPSIFAHEGKEAVEGNVCGRILGKAGKSVKLKWRLLDSKLVPLDSEVDRKPKSKSKGARPIKAAGALQVFEERLPGIALEDCRAQGDLFLEVAVHDKDSRRLLCGAIRPIPGACFERGGAS